MACVLEKQSTICGRYSIKIHKIKMKTDETSKKKNAPKREKKTNSHQNQSSSENYSSKIQRDFWITEKISVS